VFELMLFYNRPFLCCTLYYLAYVLYISPDIVRLIKSRRMRWAGHVARMGEKWNAYKILI